jgi:hypothetical protein
MFNVLKLHKGIVALHFNANQLAVGFKEHAQIITFGGLLVKIHDKEGFRGLDTLAAIILLALDATIAAGKFCAKRGGDVWHIPGRWTREAGRGRVSVFLWLLWSVEG